MDNNWGDSLNSLGLGVVGAVDDVIGGLGNNFEAQGLANVANAQSIQVRNQLAVASFQAEQQRKDKQMDLIKTVTIVILIIVFLSVGTTLAMKVFKRK